MCTEASLSIFTGKCYSVVVRLPLYVQANAQEKFMRIKHAYNTIINSDTQSRYDTENRKSDYSYSSAGRSQNTQEEEFYGFGTSLTCYYWFGYCYHLRELIDFNIMIWTEMKMNRWQFLFNIVPYLCLFNDEVLFLKHFLWLLIWKRKENAIIHYLNFPPTGIYWICLCV